jgi:hypothetical protein
MMIEEKGGIRGTGLKFCTKVIGRHRSNGTQIISLVFIKKKRYKTINLYLVSMIVNALIL